MMKRTPYPIERRALKSALVSVVLPVYNEAGVLESLAARLSKILDACEVSWEIVFVDDGSSDESPRILDELAAANPAIRVVHLARNFGHQAAVQAGLAHARGDAVVLMDSDMQDSPEALVQFVSKWRSGYDVVYAVRTERKEGRIKRCLFAAFHRLMARVASIRIPADAGIFGLVDRRVVTEILNLDERDRYFPGLRSWVGFRQCGVGVARNARYDGHPRVSLLGLVRLAKTAIFSFSTFPLFVFHVIAGLSAAVFVGVSSYALYCRLLTDLAVPGWTSHILAGSFFGAINALGICILGEYVVRIYDQVRQRPMYVVDRTVNFAYETSAGEKHSRDGGVSLDLLDELARLLDEDPAASYVSPSAPPAYSPDFSSSPPDDSNPVILPIGEEHPL